MTSGSHLSDKEWIDGEKDGEIVKDSLKVNPFQKLLRKPQCNIGSLYLSARITGCFAIGIPKILVSDYRRISGCRVVLHSPLPQRGLGDWYSFYSSSLFLGVLSAVPTT